MKPNSLWHFGDSYGTWASDDLVLGAKKGYSEYIADYYNLNFSHHAVGGYSTDEILNSILLQYNNFKSGDFILINWTFFVRFTYLNKFSNPRSFNNILWGIELSNYNPDEILIKNNIDNIDYLNYLIFHKSEFMREDIILKWKLIINPLLNNLINIGCVVINSFNNSNTKSPALFDVDNEDISLDISTELLQPPNKKLNWKLKPNDRSEYIGFLINKNYQFDGQDTHYKFGIQEELSKEWINRIDSQILTNPDLI